jgi:hypothetical protein
VAGRIERVIVDGPQHKLVYLDVNVVRDLAEKRISAAETKLEILRENISSRRLAVVPSFECFAEVLFILPHDEAAYERVFQLYCAVADWHHLLGDAADVLKADIISFAETGGPASPFVSVEESSPFMRAVTTGQDVLPRGVLLDIVHKSHDRSKQFVDSVFDPRRMESLKGKYKSAEFLGLWEPGHTAEVMASDFAERFGVLDECKDRGLMNLLKLPTVRSCIGYILHTWYRQLRSSAKAEKSCAYDFRHAVLAGAVGSIVTEDKKLRGTITAIPGHNIRAWSLDMLIAQLA